MKINTSLIREIVNNFCASILSGIVVPIAFTFFKKEVYSAFFSEGYYILYCVIVSILSIILFVMLWKFLNWRQKYGKYKLSFSIGYFTGIVSTLFLMVYFYFGTISMGS